jgi:probable phosphoglycerate mutase
MAEPEHDLWIVRHGETAWSRAGCHTGRTDVPLTDAGVAQATAVGARLAGHAFATVLSSPLRRAWDTCRLAGFGAVARPSEDLLEWDYGAYEGRTSAEIRAEVPGWTIWASGVAQGETIEAVAARARRAIAASLAGPGDALLVSHGHLLRILAACWLGLPPRDGRLLVLSTASVGVLGHEHGTRVLSAWNT